MVIGPESEAEYAAFDQIGEEIPARQEVIAQHQGRCPECHEPIFVGDLIVKCEDGWRHEECAPEDASEGGE